MRARVGPGLHRLESLRQQALAYLARCSGCSSPATIYAVELALEEWLTNVFRHGEGTEVTVEVGCDGQRVCLRFADDGRPFDPTAAPERVAPATLDEAVPGGLGLFLIRRYSRRWHYTRVEGHNFLEVEIECAER